RSLLLQQIVDAEAALAGELVVLGRDGGLGEPGEDVADGRLARLVPEQPRNDAVLDDAAHSVARDELAVEEDVADARAHDRDHRPGLRHRRRRRGDVRVDVRYRDGGSWKQAGPRRLLLAQPTRTISDLLVPR